jgi:antitoxin ParD1/3/4
MIQWRLARGTVRKTITLTEQQDAWVKSQIENGNYTNESEIISDLIRREQERTAEIDTVRAALIEAENSGEPQPFDPEAFKERMSPEGFSEFMKGISWDT